MTDKLREAALQPAEQGVPVQPSRDDVLEEAAQLCVQWGNARKDDRGGHALRNCAEAIRALKGAAPPADKGADVPSDEAMPIPGDIVYLKEKDTINGTPLGRLDAFLVTAEYLRVVNEQIQAAAPSLPVDQQAAPAGEPVAWMRRHVSSDPMWDEFDFSAIQQPGFDTPLYTAAPPVQAAVPSGWIPVSERLPKPYINVLVWPYPTEYCIEAQIQGDFWCYGEDIPYHGHAWSKTRPTHWMPLPAAPAQECAPDTGKDAG